MREALRSANHSHTCPLNFVSMNNQSSMVSILSPKILFYNYCEEWDLSFLGSAGRIKLLKLSIGWTDFIEHSPRNQKYSRITGQNRDHVSPDELFIRPPNLNL